MPADAEEGMGVVLHDDDGIQDPKHACLTGLDLHTGTVAWHREQDADRLGDVDLHSDDAALGAGRIATAMDLWKERPALRTLDARADEAG